MAQYIQTPDFSYEPMPMEAYMQMAKEVAAGYAEGINSANAYLASLPIATGALDDPNGDRAAQFRDQYGSEVEDAIQLYMDTKDKRSLASALTNVTRKMQSDEQLLVHNYLAASSEDILKRHQDNPNGWFGYTLDNSADITKKDENGNIVSNLVLPSEGGGLGAAKSLYGNYLSGYDIAQDTSWIDKFGTSAVKFINEATRTFNPETGKYEFTFQEKKYSNIMDYFKGNPSNEFMESARTLYNSQSNAMTRAYRGKYGYEEGLNKFIEDSFSYRLPMEYSRGMGYDETTPGQYANTTGQTQTPTTELYSADVLANVFGDFGDALSPAARTLVDETLKEARRRERETGKSLRDIAMEDAEFGRRLTEAQQALMAEQIRVNYDQSVEGGKLKQEYTQNITNYFDIDKTGIWQHAQDYGIDAEQLIEFDSRFEIPFINQDVNGIGVPKPIGMSMVDGKYQVLTDEGKRIANEVSILGKGSQLAAMFFGEDFQVTNANKYSQNATYLRNLGRTPGDSPLLPTREVTVDGLFTEGILDPDNQKDRNMYNFLKDLPSLTVNNDVSAYEAMADNFDEGVSNKTLKTQKRDIFEGTPNPLYSLSLGIAPSDERFYNAGLYFDALLEQTKITGLKATDYTEKLADYMRSGNVASGETLVTANAQYQKTLDETEGVQLAKDLYEASTDKDAVFFSQYDVYRLDDTDAEATPFSRYKQSKIAPGDDILKEALDDKGRSQVRINGYSIPSSDKLRGGIKATIGTTPILVIPKNSGQPDKYTDWLNKGQTSLGAQPLYPKVFSGPFAGISGRDVLAYSDFHNVIVETGVIGFGSPNKGGFDSRLAKTIAASPNLDSSGKKLIDGRNNTALENAIPVSDLDDSDLISILNEGTAVGQSATISLNLGYGYRKEDESIFSWDDYFEGFDQNNFISLREADAIAQSQQITDDVEIGKIAELMSKVQTNLKTKQGEDGNSYSVIKGKDFIDMYKEVVGKEPDFSQQVRFTDANDAILMYGLKVDQYRGSESGN